MKMNIQTPIKYLSASANQNFIWNLKISSAHKDMHPPFSTKLSASRMRKAAFFSRSLPKAAPAWQIILNNFCFHHYGFGLFEDATSYSLGDIWELRIFGTATVWDQLMFQVL